jgi:spermidine/putrescine transport system permease protein
MAETERKGGRLLRVYTMGVMAYLVLPILVVILFGFNDSQGRFNFAWQGFTLDWYRQLFDIPDLTTAIRNSLSVAAVSSLIATILGTMLALALQRYRFRFRNGFNLMLFMNISSPEIVTGASLLTLFVAAQFQRGFLTILIAHVAFSIVYVTITVRARLAGFDESLEEAAQDLGANPWRAFWKVTFPLIFPGILAGGMLAFALSIDDYVITSFVAGQTLTFPLWVVGASRLGIPPQVNVMATLIFVGGLVLAATSLLMQTRAAQLAKRPART